jgi:alanine-glyoxylate transaminase/serine-glyoxylate transaminase/serine-pyruvate transaminase
MSSLAPPRRLLFGPGPTQVEPRVYDAMTKPVVGYLDPFFFEVVEEVRRDLRVLFGTANPLTIAISGTGSAGMETAVSNFAGPGTKLAVFVSGYFGDRIAEMGRRHGATVVRCEKPWGETFTEAEASEFLDRERPQLVAFVHAETSTGALQSPRAITQPAHAVGALVIADCVTSLGAVPVEVDASGIDIAYSCSQKGLSCPPGLAPFTASPRALEQLRVNTVWYLDLKMLADYYDAHKYHHTAPISAFYALREGLAAIMEEGAPKRYARHRRCHEDFVGRIEAMGLSMHVAPGNRIATLNTVRVPDGVDDAQVRRRLLADHSIEIAGGFGPLAGKIFRIGLMGPLASKENVELLCSALAESIFGASPAKSAAEQAQDSTPDPSMRKFTLTKTIEAAKLNPRTMRPLTPVKSTIPYAAILEKLTRERHLLRFYYLGEPYECPQTDIESALEPLD